MADFDPFSLIGGALSVGGSIFTNAQNIRQQDKMMDWQERMANSAHQREVDDLRAAGLNPMLSGMKGQGAFTPSQSPVQMENPLAGAAGLASAAQQERRNQETQKFALDESAARTTKELMAAAESGARATAIEADQRRAKDKHGLDMDGMRVLQRVQAAQEVLNRASAKQAEWNSAARNFQELGTKWFQKGAEGLMKWFTPSGQADGFVPGVTPGGRSSAKQGGN